MISTSVSVIASGLYSWDLIQYEKYCMADTFNIICSTVTQAMICYIFLNIDSIQPPVGRGVSEHDEVHAVETDAHFDLQMRLWHQFMRDPDDIASIYQSNETKIAEEESFVENNNQSMHRSLFDVQEEITWMNSESVERLSNDKERGSMN